MTTSSQEVWNFIRAGRYSKALDILAQRLGSREERDYVDAAARGTIFLCLGQFGKAVQAFKEAEMIHAERAPRHGPVYLESLGVAQWLAGEREGAALTWLQAISGVLDGTISFADGAGGVSQGLLLWYGSVTMNRADYRKQAEKYLVGRAKRKRIENWPGPLAMLVLHRKEPKQVLHEYLADRERLSREMDINPGRPDLHIVQQVEAKRLVDQFSKTGSIDVVTRAARSDILLRRRFVQFLFYSAVTERESGNESECLRLMMTCASLENPLVQDEWYLAREEAARTSNMSGK